MDAVGRPYFNRRIAVLTLFFIAAFLSYTWQNSFPFFYHSDEESKALQILYGYRNYWHPMLMINATRSIGFLLGTNQDSQSITMVGRTLSALFSSVGVVALVSFACRRKGMVAGIFTGLFLLSFSLLFEVSHYCKEDSALFMGFCLTLLGVERFLGRPDWQRVMFLGITSGIATSAKYPGVILVVCLLPVIFLQTRRPRLAVLFLLTSAIVVIAINWQWLSHLLEVYAGIHREGRLLTVGHDGVAGHFPHSYYWKFLLYEHGWPLLLAALLGPVLGCFRSRKVELELVLGVFCFIILIAMSFSAKISARYLLPVMATTLYLAACSVVATASFVSLNWRPAFYAGAFLVLSWHPMWMLQTWVHEFKSDSRAEMAKWIFSRSISDQTLATSLWTRLPGIYPGQYISGMAPPDYVADLGTLEQVRDMGYRWIAVADVESERFSADQLQGNALAKQTYQRRKLFYDELRAQSDLRWSAPPGMVYNLHPGLKLYELRGIDKKPYPLESNENE